MQGRVIRIESGATHVDLGDRVLPCHLRGKLRKEAKRLGTNPVVVGDVVRVAPAGPDEGVVEEILPRNTRLARLAAGPGGRKEQVVCANVDQLLVVVAARNPDLNPRLVDRFLVSAGRGGLAPLVVVNKLDLGDADEILGRLTLYREQGFPVVLTSTLEEHARGRRGLEDLRGFLAGKVSALAGPSGSGKSSLLNALQPGLRLRTGEVSDVTGKGRHTTTGVSLLKLASGGWVVDTPGMRELGLGEVALEDMNRAFPEIARAGGGCEFRDCTHREEPGCAVSSAVGRDVSAERYQSWLAILDETQAQAAESSKESLLEREPETTRRRRPGPGRRKGWRPGRFAHPEDVEDAEDMEG